jgi:DNA recombination protein RmuC
MLTALIISFILIILLLGAIVWLAFKVPSSTRNSLQDLSEKQLGQLQQTTNLVLQQLSRQQEAQDRNSNTIHNRLDNTTKVVSDVQSKLSQIEESNKVIFEIGKDISGLQKILQAPKLRGGLGELWLGELISQIIPPEHFKLQYPFKTGDICDAVILLRDKMLLSIDSKFSLENFNKMAEAPEAEKSNYRKLFVSDTKKRIDEVAKKYILPSENTLDFAFMYIPAENVYYQAFVQNQEEFNLLDYAFSKKVVPVSPSSIYAYLQVVLMGLRGMQIEQSAKEIQKNIAGMQNNFTIFREAYNKIGNHLRNAQQNYEQGERKLDTIENKFSQITANSVDPEIEGPDLNLSDGISSK